MAKALEPYRLFFLEDPLAPDQIEWFRRLREQCATPIAMGELHTNPIVAIVTNSFSAPAELR